MALVITTSEQQQYASCTVERKVTQNGQYETRRNDKNTQNDNREFLLTRLQLFDEKIIFIFFAMEVQIHRKTKIGSKNPRVREIGGKITVFDSGGETTFGLSYREVRKNEGSRNRDSTV